MSTYVLVHGAWHTGKELEPTAAPIRAAGHQVYTPTIAGNRPGDSKKTGLDEAINSIVDYLASNNLRDVVLVGHSYGGMIITGVADRAADRIRRLVYWNAFVPNNGESLNDMVPPPYAELFDQIAAQRGDGSVVLPFPIWREVFINDADAELAQKAYDVLNPHPLTTFSRQDFAEDQSGRHADRQILRQLHRRHLAAAPLSVASAAVAETRAVPAGAGARKPRIVLHQSKTTRRRHHAGGTGLSGGVTSRQFRSRSTAARTSSHAIGVKPGRNFSRPSFRIARLYGAGTPCSSARSTM